jgi:hypothetical protein
MGFSSGIFYNIEGGKRVAPRLRNGERKNSSESLSSEFGVKGNKKMGTGRRGWRPASLKGSEEEKKVRKRFDRIEIFLQNDNAGCPMKLDTREWGDPFQ